MKQMCRCEVCIYWDPTGPGTPDGQGFCAMNPPVTHVLNGQIVTTMPVTTGATRCADGWDGEPSKDEQRIKDFMENKIKEGRMGAIPGAMLKKKLDA